MILTMLTFTLLLSRSFCEKEECSDRDTCRNNSEAKIPICFCDEECLKFKDCCKEFIVSNNQSENLTIGEHYSCVDVTTNSRRNTVKVGSFMVDSCKDGSTCNVTQLVESMIPVSTENRTFRNSYCASCNEAKNFTYWSILFDIPKSTEMKLFHFQSVLNESSMIKVTSDILTKQHYNLYPPESIIPRYCSSETVLQQEDQYQNFAMCKNTLFKNPERCIDNAGFYTDEMKCVSYDSEYLTTKDLILMKNSAVVPKSLQILVQPVSTNNDAEALNKVDNEVTSFSIMRKRVYLYFEIGWNDSVMKTSNVQLMKEYFFASMVFLKSSKFCLTNEFLAFKLRNFDGLKYVGAISFRSMTKLSLSDLEDLLNLSLALQFKETSGEVFASGFLKTVTKDFTYHKQASNFEILCIDLSKIRLESNEESVICKNLSFCLQRRTPEIIVYDVRCFSNGTGNTDISNFAHVRFSNEAFVIMLLICLGWNPSIT